MSLHLVGADENLLVHGNIRIIHERCSSTIKDDYKVYHNELTLYKGITFYKGIACSCKDSPLLPVIKDPILLFKGII